MLRKTIIPVTVSVIPVTVSVLVLMVALILNWLLIGETSPLREYFLWHVAMRNVWGFLNVVPAIISIFASGNVHAGSESVFYVAFAIQWLLIGLLVGLFLSFVVWVIRNNAEKRQVSGG